MCPTSIITLTIQSKEKGTGQLIEKKPKNFSQLKIDLFFSSSN